MAECGSKSLSMTDCGDAANLRGEVTFRRAICAVAFAGTFWLLPGPASAQMT
jgi:hypothetical protein